MSVLKK